MPGDRWALHAYDANGYFAVEGLVDDPLRYKYGPGMIECPSDRWRE